MESQQYKIGYQIKKVQISAQNTEYTIDFDTLQDWDEVTDIYIYKNPAFASNANLVIVKPLKIDNNELFCTDFDTFFLHPRLEYERFTKVNQKAKGSKVYGSIKDTAVVAAPYYITIKLRLRNTIGK